MLSRAQFQKCNLRTTQTGRRMRTVAAVSQDEGPTFVPRKKGVSDGAWQRCSPYLLVCRRMAFRMSIGAVRCQANPSMRGIFANAGQTLMLF